VTVHPLAGHPAPPEWLVDVAALCREYYERKPERGVSAERVSFGTSGHRGSSFRGTFTESHVLAITQAVCEYRSSRGITGPLFIGSDTHALSAPAFSTALEVLAGNRVDTMIDAHDRCTPTPAISHAILTHNRGRNSGLADGIVITPSHNPPEDGGFKYNPPSGGPADTDVTRWIEARANALLAEDLEEVVRIADGSARGAPTTHRHDYLQSYVNDLASVVDLQVIKDSGLRIGVDPLGGASAAFWEPIAERYGLHIDVVNPTIDPTFRFMPLDWDGRIRMDCSSPFAMARLVALRDRFDIALGTDPDADRHGIVTPGAGLMNPNHYLAAVVFYLFMHRSKWPSSAGVGKTIVSSSIIDRVARKIGRALIEVPVGFKWFVRGLLDGSLGFGGEESAGASCLRRNGTTWTTEKDGMLLSLLAAELTASTGRDPSELYSEVTRELGEPLYERIDAPATDDEKAALLSLNAEDVRTRTLAGDPIVAQLTRAPGNGAPIGGLKVVTAHGWFAARPSGTEAVYKLYAESFRGADHLRQIQQEAQAIVTSVLAGVTR